MRTNINFDIPNSLDEKHNQLSFENSSPEVLNFSLERDSIQQSSLFKIERTVVLDDKKLIGEINKIIVTADRIFVLDKLLAKTIYCFSSEGELLFTIDNNGSKEAMFSRLHDFAYDKSTNEILLLDHFYLLRFDTSGKFISKKQLPITATNFSLSPDGRYIYFSSHYNLFISEDLMYRLIAFTNDDNFEMIGHTLPYNKEKTQLSTGLNSYLCYDDHNNLLLLNELSDFVYSIDDLLVKPKYLFNFGKNSGSKHFESEVEYSKALNKEEKFWGPKTLFETKSLLVFHTTDGRYFYFGIYNKETCKSLLINMNDIKRDLYNSSILPIPLAKYNNQFIFQIKHFLFHDKRHIENFKSESEYCEHLEKLPLSEDALDIYKRTTSQSNPSLVFAKLVL